MKTRPEKHFLIPKTPHPRNYKTFLYKVMAVQGTTKKTMHTSSARVTRSTYESETRG